MRRFNICTAGIVASLSIPPSFAWGQFEACPAGSFAAMEDPDPAVGCPNCVPRSLMITKRELVASVSGSFVPQPARNVWTFEHLVRELSATDMAGDAARIEAARFVADWLRTFENDNVVVNGFNVPPRPTIRQVVIDPWKVRLQIATQGDTDEQWITNANFFRQAPFQLSAIFNRVDLAKTENLQTGNLKDAGEGRLVFQVMRARRPDEPATPLLVPEPFTIIFEYKQLANSPLELQNWAQEWFALSTEADDNVLADRLAELTPCFTDAFDAARECPFKRTQEEIDAMEPPLPNNVPLGQVRTNEIALGLRANPTLPWELREFNMCLPPPRQEAGQEQRQECLRPGIAQEQEEEQEQQQEQQQALQQEQDRPLRLLNVTVKLTPDREVFNETSLVDVLAHFVNERVDGFGVGELLRFQLSNGNDLQKVMPNVFEGFHFVSGHAITPADWLARELVPIGETQPGVFRPNPLNTWLLGTPQEDNVAFEDRLWFSFNTCNGCHSGDTGTVFTHVDLRGAGRRPPNAGPEVPLVSHNVPSNFLCNFDLPARRRGLVNMRSIAEDNNFRETLDLMQELVAQAPDGRPVDPNEQGAGIAESSLLATVEQQAVILNGPVQDGGQQDQQQQDQQQQEEQQPGGLRLPPCTMAAQRPGPIMEGQNPYDREWMACYMLERQTRVH